MKFDFLYLHEAAFLSKFTGAFYQFYVCKIKATVVYCCSILINRLRKNKSWPQTKIEGNTSNNKRGEHDTTETLKCNTHRNELYYNNGQTV